MDALEKAVARSANSEAISRAVHEERRRCATIAESFLGEANGDGEVYIVRRIIEAINMRSVRR